MQAHKKADYAIGKIDEYEQRVRENVASLVGDFEAAGCKVGVPPTFCLGVQGDGFAIVTETTADASFILGPLPL